MMTWPDSALKLMGSARVMTIATCSLYETPITSFTGKSLDICREAVESLPDRPHGRYTKGSWSAPVYYVCRNKMFYFFSNSKSRHIRDTGIQNGKSKKQLKAGASIFSDSCCFDKIKGIQMTGIIEQVLIEKQALAAAGDYLKKFRINIGKQNALQFIAQHFHASFYKFIPESVFFMDNSLKLGFREELSPDELP